MTNEATLFHVYLQRGLVELVHFTLLAGGAFVGWLSPWPHDRAAVPGVTGTRFQFAFVGLNLLSWVGASTRWMDETALYEAAPHGTNTGGWLIQVHSSCKPVKSGPLVHLAPQIPRPPYVSHLLVDYRPKPTGFERASSYQAAVPSSGGLKHPLWAHFTGHQLGATSRAAENQQSRRGYWRSTPPHPGFFVGPSRLVPIFKNSER